MLETLVADAAEKWERCSAGVEDERDESALPKLSSEDLSRSEEPLLNLLVTDPYLSAAIGPFRFLSASDMITESRKRAPLDLRARTGAKL